MYRGSCTFDLYANVWRSLISSCLLRTQAKPTRILFGCNLKKCLHPKYTWCKISYSADWYNITRHLTKCRYKIKLFGSKLDLVTTYIYIEAMNSLFQSHGWRFDNASLYIVVQLIWPSSNQYNPFFFNESCNVGSIYAIWLHVTQENRTRIWFGSSLKS